MLDTSSPPRQAQRVLATVFFGGGVVTATWVARIPAVKSGLKLGDGAFGLALVAAGIGALLAFPAAGFWCARRGSRQTTVGAAVLLALTLPTLALAHSMLGFTMALFVFGGISGAMDVAMNAHGVQVERELGLPVLSSLHGMFSLGGLAGAIVGGLAAGANLPVVIHFLLVAAALGLVLLWVAPRLLPPDPGEGAGGFESLSAFAWPARGLIGLGMLALCAQLGEGAIGDWSAIYLHDHLHTEPEFASLGYGAFSLAMVAGRLGGDTLTVRFGPVTLLRVGGITAGLGLAGALALELPGAALAGFAAVGLGLATSAPLIFNAAGRMPGRSPGAAIAAVATMGYGGFLLGPPLLGLLAEMTSLRVALGFVASTCLLLTMWAKWVQTGPEKPPSRH